MPVELECKVRVPSHDDLRARLRTARAQFVSRVLETNRLFDDDAGSLFTRGCGLRIRFVQTLEGPPVPPTLTFKGPLQTGPFKRREEIDVDIHDADAMASFLRALGYREHLTFEKRRESWLLGDCEIELDELPQLGCFVEIEAESDESIHKAMAALGIANLPSIRQSYAALVADAAGPAAKLPIICRFES